MKKYRVYKILWISTFLGICLWSNCFWMEAKEQEDPVTILATQEVEEKTGLVIKNDVHPMANSIYYNEAKGWIFNDIIYMDGCATYGSSYGGTPVGMLTPGYYRFVKSNGSYVALCEVDLVADCIARKAYAELWEKYGGMWSWEQAFYNQLDGTPELTNPTDKKTAKLENGVTVTDITQNYRFIKCWIKIEDLRTNPEMTAEEYVQTVRYYIYDARSGKYNEKTELKQEITVKKGKMFERSVENEIGHQLEKITLNGNGIPDSNISYMVISNNEVCVYYTPYQLKITLHANDRTNEKVEVLYYYGERQQLCENPFVRDEALFLGWSLSADNVEVAYTDEETLNNDLSYSSRVLDLYAVWDFAPGVKLPDLYFTKKELFSKNDIEEYVLSFCGIKNYEDESLNIEKPGVVIKTDLRKEIQKITKGWVEYQVEITTSTGNTVQKWGRLYIVDPTPFKNREKVGYMRFISKDYVKTLAEGSIWRRYSGYYNLLITCLNETEGVIWKKTQYGWKSES